MQGIHRLNTKDKITSWAILLPFNTNKNSKWIDDFGNRADLKFTKIVDENAPASWHKRGPTTPFIEWIFYLKHAAKALRMRSDGIITSFPQLAFTTALLLTLFGARKTRLIAWTFNLGSVSQSWKGRIAGIILRRVNVFIVHSSAEEKTYSDWLRLPQNRFRFIPLQRGAVPKFETSTTSPYIVTMGSANRDYATFVEAISSLDIPVVIISKKSILSDIPNLPHITKLHDISYFECLKILASARICVVPIKDIVTASGQISFINSMLMGVPTIATKSPGTVDYIEDGRTGFLCEPNDAQILKDTMLRLWNDDVLHEKIAHDAMIYAENHFSDEAAAVSLFDIIDETLKASDDK